MIRTQINQLAKNAGLLGLIGSGLAMSLSAIPMEANAQQSPQPGCPGVYYDEPFNRISRVPQGCPPNIYTRRLMRQGQLPQMQGTVSPVLPDAALSQRPTPPLPEVRSDAIAYVAPINNTVNIRLINNTNTQINYEAVSYTGDRVLAPQSEIVLRNLPLPVSLPTWTNNDVLVKMASVQTEPGMVTVVLEEETTLDDNASALRIQPDGQIFLN